MPKLYLSHKTNPKIFVNSQDVAQLKSYHFHGIRSIYGTYKQKYRGTILNYKHVKPAIVVYSFLSAMKNIGDIKIPILIICSERNISSWNYEMNKLSTVKILSNNSDRSIFETTDCVVLCSIENLKFLRPFATYDWSFVIIDDIDVIAGKMIAKQVSGNFNIALTTKDFIGDDKDYKTKWHILNWTNPKLFGKINDFEEFDKLHYNNLRNPYDEIWHDMDGSVDDDILDEVERNESDYDKVLDEWGRKHVGFSTRNRENPRKRKSCFTRNTQEKKRGKNNSNYDNSDKRRNNEDNPSIDSNRNKPKSISFAGSTTQTKVLEKRSKSTSVLEKSSNDLFDEAWIEGFMIDIKIPDEFLRNSKFTTNNPVDKVGLCWVDDKTIQNTGRNEGRTVDKEEETNDKVDHDKAIQNKETNEEIVMEERTVDGLGWVDDKTIQNTGRNEERTADKEEQTNDKVEHDKAIQNKETNEEIVIEERTVDDEEHGSNETIESELSDNLVLNPLAKILQDITIDNFEDCSQFSQLKSAETNDTTDASTDDENPIISAIINGSPLKNAFEKEATKRPRRKIKMQDFEESEKVSPVKANDFLKSLFGDEAVIIEDEPTFLESEPSIFVDEPSIFVDEPLIFEEDSQVSSYIRVKGVQEINEYTSSQNFKRSFDDFELMFDRSEQLSCSQRSKIMSSLFDV